MSSESVVFSLDPSTNTLRWPNPCYHSPWKHRSWPIYNQVISCVPLFIHNNEESMYWMCYLLVRVFRWIRLLVSNGFHSSCIDLWFELHNTFPIYMCELDLGMVESGVHESLHNTVTITIGPKPWRSESSFRFKTTVASVKTKGKHYLTVSSVVFKKNHSTTRLSKRLMEASGGQLSRSHETTVFWILGQTGGDLICNLWFGF